MADRAVVASCPAGAFQGWHIGIGAGAVDWSARRVDRNGFAAVVPMPGIATGAVPTIYTPQTAAGIVGADLGYSWTRCNVLFGVELQGDWVNGRTSTSSSVLDPVTAAGGPGRAYIATFEGHLKGFVALKTRTGVAFENLLLFIVGGAAAARFETTYGSSVTGPALAAAGLAPAPFAAAADYSEWRLGWVAGFGAEYAWSERISIKSETLYASFPDRDQSTRVFFTPAIAAALLLPGRSFAFTHSDSMWIGKVGISVKLGSIGR
jgi:opacity protein-like surface antigen